MLKFMSSKKNIKPRFMAKVLVTVNSISTVCRFIVESESKETAVHYLKTAVLPMWEKNKCTKVMDNAVYYYPNLNMQIKLLTIEEIDHKLSQQCIDNRVLNLLCTE